MVTVATRYNLDEACLIRSMLEGSGIRAFIPDEFTAQNDWGYITAIGGIRIQVSPDNEEAAREIIADSFPLPGDDSPGLACPHCDSTSVKPSDLGKRIALVSLLMLCLPLPFSRNTYLCEDCGEKFKKPD